MRTANLCLENGDDLRTQMPALAAHIGAARTRRTE
jgi:hypothetical protein